MWAGHSQTLKDWKPEGQASTLCSLQSPIQTHWWDNSLSGSAGAVGSSHSFSAPSWIMIKDSLMMRTIRCLPVVSKCNNSLCSVIKMSSHNSKLHSCYTFLLPHCTSPRPAPQPDPKEVRGMKTTWPVLLGCGIVLSRLSGCLQPISSLVRVRLGGCFLAIPPLGTFE